MGLDMYLTAKKYNWNDGILEYGFKVESTSIEVGYWRKANQIHNWFVVNCQEGNDDCEKYSVERYDLVNLRETCKYVLENSKLIDGLVASYQTFVNGEFITHHAEGKIIENDDIAKSLLPTSEGFFFGYTDYDEYYIEVLKNTIEIIDKALELPKDWDFYYQSSW